MDISLEVDDEVFGGSSLNDLTPEESTEESAETAIATEEDLIAAFANKYEDWDVDNIVIDLSTADAEFASGGVGFADSFGGGYFYAANTADGWVIAWDGNGDVSCADIEPYDFPAEMIRYCYDYENDVTVER